MSRRLSDLAALAGMIRDSELAELAQRSERQRWAEARMQDLREAQARGLASAAPDAAHVAGADATWLLWSGRAVRVSGQAAAQAAARVEDQKAVARLATGRAEVLSRLAAVSRRRGR